MGYRNDDLGTRMKEFYEQVPKFKLYRRTPVAIRIDGKAFHTFTRGFQKPFDEVLGNAMVETMKYLCTNIQGCVFGYCQSDEITLLLVDYQTHETPLISHDRKQNNIIKKQTRWLQKGHCYTTCLPFNVSLFFLSLR